MTQATGRVFGVETIDSRGAVMVEMAAPLAASVAPSRNHALGFNASGYVVEQAQDVTGLVSAGFANQDTVDAGGSDGDARTRLQQSFVAWPNNSSVSGDGITQADMAVPFYWVDNQTPGKKSNAGGHNRSVGGLAFGLDGKPGNSAPILYVGPIAWLIARATMVTNAAPLASYGIADASASAATAERTIRRPKWHGTVTSIEFTGAAVAADNTDYVTVTVSKRDGAGGNAVTLGTYDSRAANQGAISAFQPAAFSLSAVAGALDLLETDVVTITVAKGGSGKSLVGEVLVNGKVL